MVDSTSQSKALKVKWLHKLVRCNDEICDEFWVHWVKYNIPEIDIDYLLRCNINVQDIKNVVKFKNDSIWLEIFVEWCYLNFDHYPIGKEDILHQSIWFNSHIKVGKKMVFNKMLYKAGIKYIKDIVRNNKFLTIWEIN